MGWAVFQLGLGTAAGLLLLELVLQLNVGLLLRGMAAPGPIEAALTQRSYVVRLSEADLFFWHGGLIRPIAGEDDAVAAEVAFATDEFGFPNAAPASATTDVIILGRSFSVGAQAAQPWPRRLAGTTGYSVTNLSQAAVGVQAKHSYLRRFGLARQPRWVILEILPSMDILGYGPEPTLLVPQLPVPLVQTFARWWLPPSLPAGLTAPIYPLSVNVGGRPTALVFFSHYLAALTVDEAELAASTQWAGFQAQALALAAEAEANGACVALLYAPTKEEIYVPLADDPAQLRPVLSAGWLAWQVGADGQLIQNDATAPRVEVLQAQAAVAREAVRTWAAAQGWGLIDPSDAMRAAALRGDDPFMRYDSHWSAGGHAIVADLADEVLSTTACP